MEKLAIPYRMPRAEQKIRAILLRLAEGGYVCGEFFSIGPVESMLVCDAKSRGIIVAKGHLFFSDTQVQHALRDAKRIAGIAVSSEELATFPRRLRRMELWFDKGHHNYIYLDRKSKSKYIIDTNRRIKLKGKKSRRALVITTQKMRSVNLFGTDLRYEKVRD